MATDEYITFQKFTSALDQAEKEALTIARQRNDQRWLKISELIGSMKQQCFMLVGDGQLGPAVPLDKNQLS